VAFLEADFPAVVVAAVVAAVGSHSSSVIYN
jgi:hypothetical protein